MLEAAARAGEALIEQRDLCQTTRGGSTFSRWCEENLPFSRSLAIKYIAVTENWELVNAFTSNSEPPSLRDAVKLIAEAKREEREAERDQEPDVELPDGTRVITDLAEVAGEKFSVIYADPPWQYGNQATRASTDNHYTTMTTAEICEMPVADLAADNAQLHLWTTNGFLPDAMRVMEDWGFRYVSMFVWCKPDMGIGNYWRVSHELMLCGVRGSATFRDKSLRSWGEFNRGRHSAKPDVVRGMIESAFPGPYLELFGRVAVENWTVFGNQVDRTLFAG